MNNLRLHGQDPLVKKVSEILQHRLCVGLVLVVIVVVVVIVCPQPTPLVKDAAESGVLESSHSTSPVISPTRLLCCVVENSALGYMMKYLRLMLVGSDVNCPANNTLSTNPKPSPVSQLRPGPSL